MTTWHRTDHRGQQVAFTYTVDDRGNVTLTREEVEGLMRTGGWTPGPIPKPRAQWLREKILDGLPPATWGTPEDLARMSIETHARRQQEKLR